MDGERTYRQFVIDEVAKAHPGDPIYCSDIAMAMEKSYELPHENACAAAAATLKTIIDAEVVPALRRYKRGIYYLTEETPFGEAGIRRGQLIADRYLLPDIGYETGAGLMLKMGLTTWVPNEWEFVTNKARSRRRVEDLGIAIRPPRCEKVTADNKGHLQTLDALDLLDRTPVDADDPYGVIAAHIVKARLDFEKLTELAEKHYGQNVLAKLAHVAGRLPRRRDEAARKTTPRGAPVRTKYSMLASDAFPTSCM